LTLGIDNLYCCSRNHYEQEGNPINPEEIINNIIKLFREKGLKITPQRLEVINVLAHDAGHPSALAIFRKARVNAPTISLSTVYYTLTMLKKHRLVKELEFNGMDNRYEGNTSHHLNLICIRCGSIQDFIEEMPFSTRKVEEGIGFHAVDTRMEYYGYCRECKPNQG